MCGQFSLFFLPWFPGAFCNTDRRIARRRRSKPAPEGRQTRFSGKGKTPARKEVRCRHSDVDYRGTPQVCSKVTLVRTWPYQQYHAAHSGACVMTGTALGMTKGGGRGDCALYYGWPTRCNSGNPPGKLLALNVTLARGRFASDIGLLMSRAVVHSLMSKP